MNCVRLHQKKYTYTITSCHIPAFIHYVRICDDPEFAMTQTRLTAYGSCATRSTSSQRVGNSKTTASLNAMIK